MSDQNFYFDVYNNTSRTIRFSITGNINLEGAQGTYTIAPYAWMSAQHGDAPFPLQLLEDTGTLNFLLNDQATTNSGTFVLELDGTQLTNFPGMAFYGSQGDLANPVRTSTGFIFPLLYMNQLYAGAPLAVLMLVEAAGATSTLTTPYAVG